LEYKTPHGTTVYPDGTLKDALRQDWGYWESKDTLDSLDDEIQKKLAKGYPTTNILFEDSRTAVLIRNGQELQRASFDDHMALHSLITTFVTYEPLEVRTFREAIDRFKEDLPDLIVKLRELIEDQAARNASFKRAREDFLELCRESINPHIAMADIREMIIPHILTEDIFITVFNDYLPGHPGRGLSCLTYCASKHTIEAYDGGEKYACNIEYPRRSDIRSPEDFERKFEDQSHRHGDGGICT
jgi:hypothetical protein